MIFKTMNMKTMLAILLLLGLTLSLHAAVLVRYDINDTDGLTAGTLASGVSATDLTSPDWTLAIANDDFINIPESGGMEDGTGDNMVAAFNSGQFIEFTISTPSYYFELGELQMTLERAGQGPQDWGLRISTDGFAGGYSDTGLAAFDLDYNQSVSATATLKTVDLSGLVLDAATTYTFRVAYDDRINNSPSNSAGRFYDIQVTRLIPEPASLGLLGLGLFLLRRFRNLS